LNAGYEGKWVNSPDTSIGSKRTTKLWEKEANIDLEGPGTRKGKIGSRSRRKVPFRVNGLRGLGNGKKPSTKPGRTCEKHVAGKR